MELLIVVVSLIFGSFFLMQKGLPVPNLIISEDTGIITLDLTLHCRNQS